MKKLIRLFVLAAGLMLLGAPLRADTYHMTDGKTVTGDIVNMDDNGLLLKLPDGQYGERIPWIKFTQEDLKMLQQNPKAADYVEPYIELTKEDRRKKTDIELKEVPRLARPTGQSFFGAIFGSGVGLMMVLLIYGGNMWAAYEVAVFRAHPKGLVLGVSAVLPIIGPAIFVAIPQIKKREADWQAPPEEYVEAGIAEAVAAEQAAEGAAEQAAVPAGPVLPATKSFARGQFTFNRRFFETQLPTFFAVNRITDDKDMVLTVKTSKGLQVVQRISRVTATEVSVMVPRGTGYEEVAIPYGDLQLVELKHKDA